MNPENRSGDHAEYKAYTPPPPKTSRKAYLLPIGLFLTAFSVILLGIAIVVDNARENREEPNVGKPQAAVETTVEEDPTNKLVDWYLSLETEYEKFANDLDAVAQNNSLPTYTQCETLKDDVEALQAKPIPNDYALVSNNWNRAMNSYYRAFSACMDGDYITLFASMSEGTTSMNAATEALPNG